LAETLEINSTLVFLDLRDNKIGSDGAKSLAEALQKNSTLVNIDLRWNNINDEGSVRLFGSLKRNSTLTSVDLRHNNIGPEGARRLAETLQTNFTLTSIDLHKNEISKELKHTIEEHQKKNRIEQLSRRNRLLRNLLILTRPITLTSTQHSSIWSRLPLDMRRYLLLECLCSNQQLASSVGKTRQQLQSIVRFLFANNSQLQRWLTIASDKIHLLEKNQNAGESLFRIEA